MAELLGCPFKGSRSGGWGSNFTYVSYNTGMSRPNGWILHKKKSINMCLILTPQDPETWVKFIENRVKKSWRKFWKIGRQGYPCFGLVAIFEGMLYNFQIIQKSSTRNIMHVNIIVFKLPAKLHEVID